MSKGWIVLRLSIFLLIAPLLLLGFIVAGIMHGIVFSSKGRDTIRRWFNSWWGWVTGKMSTYELIC
jgi:hypothetical protein